MRAIDSSQDKSGRIRVAAAAQIGEQVREANKAEQELAPENR
jgi:hypothetical protein